MAQRVCSKLLEDCASPLTVSTSQQDLQSESTLWKHPVFCQYQCPLELNDYRSVALTRHIMKSLLIWGHLELM